MTYRRMLVLFKGSVRNLISPLIFFYEFFKSVTIHPGAFWYSRVNVTPYSFNVIDPKIMIFCFFFYVFFTFLFCFE